MELKEMLLQKRGEIAAFYAENKNVDGTYGKNDSFIIEREKREAELKGIVEQVSIANAEAENKSALETMTNVQRAPIAGGAEAKSLGERFVETAQFKSRSSAKFDSFDLPMDVKTLMTTAANGYAPFVTRNGDVVPLPHRPLGVLDLLRSVDAGGQNAVKFMAQTVQTIGTVVEKGEGVAAGEAVLTWAEQSVNIVKIPAFIPVSDEQLADVPGVIDLINSELAFAVMARIDSQILNGDGTGGTMLGLLSGANVQAKGANPVFDTIGLATKTIAASEYMNPNATVMNPTDYWNMRLTRTADGIYIMGNPADAGAVTIFGQAIVQSTALTAGTALTGDWTNGGYLSVRQGATFEMGYQNDDFVKGQKCVKVTVRVGLPIRRAHAFTKSTGL